MDLLIVMSRFSRLADLAKETSSDGRREILRQVTDAMERQSFQGGDVAVFDEILSTLAADYSTQVRANLARLVASSNAAFARSAQMFALDEKIEVAAPVLTHSRALSEETLLKVVEQRGHDHMMVVSTRPDIGHRISHALVERGNDAVVSSLLANEKAQISPVTFDAVAKRAEVSAALQAPMVRRKDVPLYLLSEMYQKVQNELRKEILEKFNHIPPEEVESAFRRSRDRLQAHLGGLPADMTAAKMRIAALSKQGGLNPLVLISLLREGAGARTAFMLAFANLVDVEFDLVQRTVEHHDIDTVALLCRGANFQRALFVALALALDGQDRGLAAADEFTTMYESVPVTAAQRALRFWKVRHAV
jgi:uncharacterized protein (DUF2336 family)